MQNERKLCRNCGQHLLIEQKFCPTCGQKADTERIDFHFLIHEIQHGIFHVDKGILYSIKMLFTKPGHTIREYLEGRRKNHFKPVLFVVILGTLCGLLNHFVIENGEREKFFEEEDDPQLAQNQDFINMSDFLENIIGWFADHLAFLILLMIPAAALGFYLGFRKYRLYYAEWLVVMTFLAGQALVVYFFTELIGHFMDRDLMGLFLLIAMSLNIWTFLQFFKGRSKKIIVIRTLWSNFLSFTFTFFYVMFLSLTLLLTAIVMYASDETLEQLSSDDLEININPPIKKDSAAAAPQNLNP